MYKSLTLLYISFTIAPIIATYFVRTKRKTIRSSTDRKAYYYNVFPIYKNSCRDHVIKSEPCSSQCSQKHLNLLVDFIKTAKYSISICVLTLQLIDIIQELLKAHERGLNIRIILDREMISANCWKFRKLKVAGIPVKTQKLENGCMHHKFCILDENEKVTAKMFFGSLNLTLQGILCNYEHITLTNNYNMIERFSEEFNSLWNEFI